MATTVRTLPRRAMFLDDDPAFLEAVRYVDQALTLELHTTSDSEQSLKRVAHGDIDVLVADLAMPGQPDGITILETAHRSRAGVQLMLLTGHQLTQGQQQRLRKINARQYDKGTGVMQLFADLSRLGEDARTADSVPIPVRPHGEPSSQTPRQPASQTTEITELQERIMLMEQLYDEWVADIVEELRQVPDADKSYITSSSGRFSVAELIKDLELRTARGVQHVRLWSRAFRALDSLKTKSDDRSKSRLGRP
jgi:CheY-like chemotaxis protein